MDFQGKLGLKRAGIWRKKSFVIDVSDWESEEYFSSFVTVWSYLSKLGSRLSVAFAALCVVGLLTWCGMRPRPSIGRSGFGWIDCRVSMASSGTTRPADSNSSGAWKRRRTE